MDSLRRSVFKGALLLVFAQALLASSVRASPYAGLNHAADVVRFSLVGVALAVPLIARDQQGVIQLGVSTAATAAVVQGLKWSVHRRRPDGQLRSFPSGHTSFAFSMASFIHYRYGWQFGLPAYIAAGFVGYSRIQSHRHHVTDVIAGALIANVIAYFLVDSRCRHVIMVPIINAHKRNFGLLAAIRF